jgi:predicted nucleic-acid-binding Zn-ribbon protein
MSFTFTSNGKCPKCGGDSFTSPSNPYDHAPITCLGCGHVTTVDKAVRAFNEAKIAPKPLADGKR